MGHQEFNRTVAYIGVTQCKFFKHMVESFLICRRKNDQISDFAFSGRSEDSAEEKLAEHSVAVTGGDAGE